MRIGAEAGRGELDFLCAMKKIYLFPIVLQLMINTLHAQAPHRLNMQQLIQKIPVLSPTVEALHRDFTRQTPYGEKFRDAELLNPVYDEVKRLVAILHHQKIRAAMQAHPRRDMPDSIHYEEVRNKLALRPVIIENRLAAVVGSDENTRTLLRQVMALQAAFDWQVYFKKYDSLEKSFREKEAALPGDHDIHWARKRLELQQQLYGLQRDLWVNRLDKYSKGGYRLQQLLEEAHYGHDGPSRDEVVPLLADVQARALEAIEKLIWSEMLIVTKGELLFQDLKILEHEGA